MLNLSRSPSRFSERETQKHCDAEHALYRSFWDAEGSLHRGVFDDPEEPGSGSILRDGFLRASSRLNAIMLENSGIDGTARALSPGCGNGNTATCRCCSMVARVAGIDLSSVGIANAIETLEDGLGLARAWSSPRLQPPNPAGPACPSAPQLVLPLPDDR